MQLGGARFVINDDFQHTFGFMARTRRQERGARIYTAGHFLEKFPETEPHDDKLTEKALHVMYPMYVLKECRASFILGGQPPSITAAAPSEADPKSHEGKTIGYIGYCPSRI